jgi:hypothetical protein
VYVVCILDLQSNFALIYFAYPQMSPSGVDVHSPPALSRFSDATIMSVVRIPCLNCVISAGDFLLAQKAVVNLHLSAYIVQEVLLPHHVRVLW